MLFFEYSQLPYSPSQINKNKFQMNLLFWVLTFIVRCNNESCLQDSTSIIMQSSHVTKNTIRRSIDRRHLFRASSRSDIELLKNCRIVLIFEIVGGFVTSHSFMHEILVQKESFWVLQVKCNRIQMFLKGASATPCNVIVLCKILKAIELLLYQLFLWFLNNGNKL